MLSILKNRTFLLLFLGNTISLVGFGFNLVGVSWLVLEVTGSELALGKIMAMATVPGVLLALFAGIIIDKVNRKWLLVVLDLFRMIVVGSFVILLVQNRFSMTALFIMVLLMGAGSSLFWPTAQAFVQELVSTKDYFHANALLSARVDFRGRYWRNGSTLLWNTYSVGIQCTNTPHFCPIDQRRAVYTAGSAPRSRINLDLGVQGFHLFQGKSWCIDSWPYYHPG